MEASLKLTTAITLIAMIFQSTISFGLPSTTLKNWTYKSFEDEKMAKSFSGGAEGAFLLNAAPGKINTTVYVFKKTLPADWKANLDTRKWKILLAGFNVSNEKRPVMKDSVLKDSKTSELSYTFEMNYMPVENVVHRSLGLIRISGDSAYLILYDRRSAEYQSDLAATKDLFKAIQL